MPRNPFDYQPSYIACSIPCADPAVLKIRDMIRLEQAMRPFLSRVVA